MMKLLKQNNRSYWLDTDENGLPLEERKVYYKHENYQGAWVWECNKNLELYDMTGLGLIGVRPKKITIREVF